jgi:hypothetical protein
VEVLSSPTLDMTATVDGVVHLHHGGRD